MKRTPKNYDGVESPAKTIGELLPALIGGLRRKEEDPTAEILQSWARIVGPSAAKFAEAVGFSDGVLSVVVRSSALYSLLCQHEKPKLLRRLQEEFPKTQVRNIVFRIG